MKQIELFPAARNVCVSRIRLRASVGSLFALAEQYPDLKTNQTFLQLQSRITGLENAIADRLRRTYLLWAWAHAAILIGAGASSSVLF